MCAMFGLSPAGKKNTANPGGGAIVGVSGTGVKPGNPSLTLRNGVNWFGVCRSICWNSGWLRSSVPPLAPKLSR